VAIEDLGLVGSDAGAYEAPDDVKYHLWSNDNSGNHMNYAATYISVGDYSLTYLSVQEDHPVVNCGGQIVVSKIEGQNLFALRLPDGSPVSGCNVVDPVIGAKWTQDGIEYTAYTVDLPYYGLGALFDLDGDGTLEFVHMMASKESGAGSTAQVLFNKFIVTP
jgi:hypothetical protein